jgi:glutamate racemase
MIIGVLDSGIGGKGIEAEIKELLPAVTTIYFNDHENFPYGSKSVDNLHKILANNVRELIDQGAQVIVLACNSATVSSIDYLRKRFDIPFVGVVPALKPAAEVTKTKHIALFATPVTCASDWVSESIKNFCQGVEVEKIPFPNLAFEIENGEIEKAKKDIELVWQKYKNSSIDTIVLGCTHYSLIRNEIQKIVGSNIVLLDSERAVALQVEKLYNEIN